MNQQCATKKCKLGPDHLDKGRKSFCTLDSSVIYHAISVKN